MIKNVQKTFVHTWANVDIDSMAKPRINMLILSVTS